MTHPVTSGSPSDERRAGQAGGHDRHDPTAEPRRIGVTAQSLAVAVLVAFIVIGVLSLGSGLVRAYDTRGDCGGVFQICDDDD